MCVQEKQGLVFLSFPMHTSPNVTLANEMRNGNPHLKPGAELSEGAKHLKFNPTQPRSDKMMFCLDALSKLEWISFRCCKCSNIDSFPDWKWRLFVVKKLKSLAEHQLKVCVQENRDSCFQFSWSDTSKWWSDKWSREMESHHFKPGPESTVLGTYYIRYTSET